MYLATMSLLNHRSCPMIAESGTSAPPGLGGWNSPVYSHGCKSPAYWRNVPAAVWGYKLGGFQVLKKWLSYRERGVLGRALRPEEAQYFTDTARRIPAILLLVNRK